MFEPFSRRLPWPVHVNALSTARARLAESGAQILDWSESNFRRVLPLKGYEGLNPGFLLSDPAILRYDPDPRGLIRAREALAVHRADAREGGDRRPADPGRYFLTASTSEAYSWLFKLLCDPGDAVLVPKPGYPLFEYLAGLEAVSVREWRLEYFHPSGWRVDFDSVEEAIRRGRSGGRVKAIVLVNPNNPTGSYISAEERNRFVAIAAREGIAIIADEVFLGFPLEGRGRSFEGEEEALTFVLDGLSKSLGLPQLKLGWIAVSGPPDLLGEAMERLEIIADSYLSAGSPVMNALPTILGEAPRFAAALGLRLAANLGASRRALERPGSPHRVYRCEGGWTLVVESPRFHGEEEIALRLLREAGLWSQPGHFFDMEREAIFTASLILPESDFSEGLRRYAEWFASEEGRLPA